MRVSPQAGAAATTYNLRCPAKSCHFRLYKDGKLVSDRYTRR